MSKLIGESSEYRSYLLRLWLTHPGWDPVWQASLEEPLTQQVVRFDTLLDLFTFLLVQTGQQREGGSHGRQVDCLDGSMPPTGTP
jgi:hypothetical protein